MDLTLAAGQMTQRLAEAVLTGCSPLMTTGDGVFGGTRDRAQLGETGAHRGRIVDIQARRGEPGRATHLLRQCPDRLDPFRLSRQLDVLDQVFTHGQWLALTSSP